MALNICQHCKREFTSRRRDKRFCSRSCQWAQGSKGDRVLPSETMLALGLVLKSAAPEGTVGYRLGLRVPQFRRRAQTGSPGQPASRPEVYWFPPEGKSLRWDDSYSEQPYFILTRTNFEPPKVPKATTYLIEFLGATGLVLPTPGIFQAGVAIAEASRMTWPGTHHVRQPRGGIVRNTVELVSQAKKD
jgi:hypothetical protein